MKILLNYCEMTTDLCLVILNNQPCLNKKFIFISFVEASIFFAIKLTGNFLKLELVMKCRFLALSFTYA